MRRTCTARRWTAAAVVGCALTAAGPAAGPAGATSFAVPREGSFIDVGGKVFKIVGGAPVRVSNWAAVGGPQPADPYGADVFDRLADYPADGTFVGTSDGRAYRFVGGAPFYITGWRVFGSAQPASLIDAAAIANAGGPADSGYSTIRTMTYDLLGDGRHVPLEPASPLPLDGNLFIRGAQTGKVYKMVGGAPVWVPKWSTYGGVKPVIVVDQAAIDHAGAAGVWRFIRKYPQDGWVVQGAQTDQAYVVAGGAPVYIGTRAFLRVPDVSPPQDRWLPARVDQRVIDHAGGEAPYDNLRFTPADGTYLAGQPVPGGDPAAPWRTYRISGDVLVETGEHHAGEVTVDQAALDQAGEPGVWAHLPPRGCGQAGALASVRAC